MRLIWYPDRRQLTRTSFSTLSLLLSILLFRITYTTPLLPLSLLFYAGPSFITEPQPVPTTSKLARQ